MSIDYSKKPLIAPHQTDYLSELLGANKGGVVQLEVDMLVPFSNQPFKPYSQLKMAELASDIEEKGILSPILVREKDGKYQILAGHNRVAAA